MFAALDPHSLRAGAGAATFLIRTAAPVPVQSSSATADFVWSGARALCASSVRELCARAACALLAWTIVRESPQQPDQPIEDAQRRGRIDGPAPSFGELECTSHFGGAA